MYDAFFAKYFRDHAAVLSEFLAAPEHVDAMRAVVGLLTDTRATSSTIYIVGNGGSAAIAEHTATDFLKNAKLRAVTFSATSLLTCLANDYGYERAYAAAIERMGERGDVLIAISSSGKSENILRACDTAAAREVTIVTFSGFDPTNPLRTKGRYNFWINSHSYGFVEMIHHLLLHAINDAVIGAVEYPAREERGIAAVPGVRVTSAV